MLHFRFYIRVLEFNVCNYDQSSRFTIVLRIRNANFLLTLLYLIT